MNISLNLNQMLFSNLHVGTNINSFDSRLKGILLGVRKKTTILNLKISILQLQIVSHLVINLISKRQPILLIKE
jgi:ribosomal protein S2